MVENDGVNRRSHCAGAVSAVNRGITRTMRCACDLPHPTELPRSEGGSGGDLVGGFGQEGEAVGQAGAGKDQGVGFDVFGLAEVCQQAWELPYAMALRSPDLTPSDHRPAP